MKAHPQKNIAFERTDSLPGPVSEELTTQGDGREGGQDGERYTAEVLVGLGRQRADWQVRRARWVRLGCFRLAHADAQRYDDLVGNYPV